LVHAQHIEILLPSTVVLTSLLGSWHCVGMCGGLIAASTHSTRSIITYHLGRLTGYCLVGGLSGWLGYFIVPKHGTLLSNVFMAGISIYFIVWGISIFKQKTSLLHFNNKFIENIFSKILRKNIMEPTVINATLVGFMSVFLPCGWLYSFVIATMPLKSPLMSMFFLSLFWAGTLPALGLSPVILRKVLTPMKEHLPKISGIVLILAGLGSLFLRV
jgi:uncharacterized protein